MILRKWVLRKDGQDYMFFFRQSTACWFSVKLNNLSYGMTGKLSFSVADRRAEKKAKKTAS